ncbi:MAG: hypothetical protein JNM18_01225 [Planctomycetaceae bacterium]|nr:hypothetical protein [Planctomycetaceae bacterium]
MLTSPPRSSSWNHGPWARWRLLALVQFLVMSLGIPLPSPAMVNANASGERFPCEGHACGCSTAAKCWKACCCMTQQQKLLWAREHGVTPPAYVLEAAAREQAIADELAQQRAATGRRPCCAKRQASQASSVDFAKTNAAAIESQSLSGSTAKPVLGSCCRTKTTTGRQCCDRGVQPSAPRSAFAWVLMIQAQRCQGESGGLFAVCVAAPPPVPVVSPVEFAFQGTLLPAVIVRPPVPALLPALPPPRVG